MAERFSCYLALGDSMSIDFYPAQDKRVPSGARQDLGAASLLFRNDSDLWKEFQGRDLDTMFPKIYFSSHAIDGASTHDLLDKRALAELEPFKTAHVLVSLTIGGNDLLQSMRFAATSNPEVLVDETRAITARFNQVVSTLDKYLQNALFLLTTVYDPTDGTGTIPGDTFRGRLPLQYLDQFNDSIKETAERMENAIFCDVHEHFLGHGSMAGADMWYWVPSPIEPGARGASEIRRVWLAGLEKWLAEH